MAGDKNSPPQQVAQKGTPNCKVNVTIGRVIRGNPYVGKDASAVKGLPDSLPPTQTYEVEIRVDPSFEKSCPGQSIDVSIVGGNAENGTATVSPAQITRTTRVTVTGGDQTKPKHGGNLKIQAALGGKVLAVSGGFTVCAHPLNFTDVYDSPVDDQVQGKHAIGIVVKDSWESDSGQAAVGDIIKDLNKVKIKELLHEPRPKEPPFHFFPFDHSDYNLGNGFSTDRHAILIPDAGPKADWIVFQLSVYECERCGCRDILMPNSGLQIIFHVMNDKGNDKGSWKFFVEKTGAKVMVMSRTATPGTANIKSPAVPL